MADEPTGEDQLNDNFNIVQESIDPEHIPIYCLTKLTDDERHAYRKAITTSNRDLYWVLPQFEPWTEGHEGNLTDLQRIWEETGGSDSQYHFAFFIDRTSVAKTSIIAAQPDEYTMVYSDSANLWAHDKLTSYLHEKAGPSGVASYTAPSGVYDDFSRSIEDDLLTRGFTYGRVPASALRSFWANLDTANMDFNELVEYHGGKVEILEDPAFDTDGCMEKLVRVIKGYVEGGGQLQ